MEENKEKNQVEVFDDVELSQEELERLDDLVDPDASSYDNYSWDQDFQRQILSLLINDKFFLIESKALVKPSYFTYEVHRRICSLLFKFFETYKSLPNMVQIVNELKAALVGKSDEIILENLTELNNVIQYFFPETASTRDYYRDKIVDFARAQTLKLAFKNSLELLKKKQNNETWSKISRQLKDVLLVDYNRDMGLSYFETYKERYLRKKEVLMSGDVFTSGFSHIDHCLAAGGLLRGEIGSYMGLSGAGKSIALKCSALANLHRGKKILYLSLELSQDMVAERFDVEIANLNLSQDRVEHGNNGITSKNLLEMQERVFTALEEYVKVVGENQSRSLIIKQFPGGQMDIDTMRSYFSQLCLTGFRPDMVIVDYVGEMKDIEGIPTHESKYRLVRDLRGFAVEENVCVLTAMQPNKSAKEALRNGLLIDDENIGDSFGQVKPLDAFWSINQTIDERNCGLARMYIVKHRAGESKKIFYVKFNYESLTVKDMSEAEYKSIYKNYLNLKDKSAADDVAEDTFNRNKMNVVEGKKASGLPNFDDDHEDDGNDNVEELEKTLGV